MGARTRTDEFLPIGGCCELNARALHTPKPEYLRSTKDEEETREKREVRFVTMLGKLWSHTERERAHGVTPRDSYTPVPSMGMVWAIRTWLSWYLLVRPQVEIFASQILIPELIWPVESEGLETREVDGFDRTYLLLMYRYALSVYMFI